MATEMAMGLDTEWYTGLVEIRQRDGCTPSRISKRIKLGSKIGAPAWRKISEHKFFGQLTKELDRPAEQIIHGYISATLKRLPDVHREAASCSLNVQAVSVQAKTLYLCERRDLMRRQMKLETVSQYRLKFERPALLALAKALDEPSIDDLIHLGLPEPTAANFMNPNRIGTEGSAPRDAHLTAPVTHSHAIGLGGPLPSTAMVPEGHGVRVPMILSSPEITPSLRDDIVRRAVAYIENKQDSICSVEELAAELGIENCLLAQQMRLPGSNIWGHHILTREQDVLFVTVLPKSFRAAVHRKQKHAIGKCFSKVIRDGDIVILDGGTTTFEIFLAIEAKIKNDTFTNVTIITNSVASANQATTPSQKDPFHPSISLAGGALFSDKGCTNSGEKTVRDFEYFVAEARAKSVGRRVIAVVGATGIGPTGCSVQSENEKITKPGIINLADFGFIVADKTKFVDHDLPYVFAEFKFWPPNVAIVTDERPQSDFVTRSGVSFFVPAGDQPISIGCDAEGREQFVFDCDNNILIK